MFVAPPLPRASLAYRASRMRHDTMAGEAGMLPARDGGLKKGPADDDQHAALYQPLCLELSDSCGSQ
jgi:hypothetical protein